MSKYGEPWEAINDQDIIRCDLLPKIMYVAGTSGSLPDDPCGTKHRDRIVACVNALADVKNPAAIAEVIAACRAVAEDLECYTEDPDWPIGRMVRAALAELDKES
jgi:hypothetical protein